MVGLNPIFSAEAKEGNITLSLEKQHEERELWLLIAFFLFTL